MGKCIGWTSGAESGVFAVLMATHGAHGLFAHWRRGRRCTLGDGNNKIGEHR